MQFMAARRLGGHCVACLSSTEHGQERSESLGWCSGCVRLARLSLEYGTLNMLGGPQLSTVRATASIWLHTQDDTIKQAPFAFLARVGRGYTAACVKLVVAGGCMWAHLHLRAPCRTRTHRSRLPYLSLGSQHLAMVLLHRRAG